MTTRPHLVPPALAARLPVARSARSIAVSLGVLQAVAIVVQAVALATAVDRSLLHHAPLRSVTPELVALAVAVIARGLLMLIGEQAAHRAATSTVRTLRTALMRQMYALGPTWLAEERAGELTVVATRGLRALHTYFSRYLPQAALATVVPPLLLVWVATQDWLSLVVVLGLVGAVPVTTIFFGREANRRAARQWRRLGSLATRFLQLVEGLATLRAFGREGYGRREVAAAAEGVRVATMRTLRVTFLSALSMDLIAGFGVGLVAMVLGLRLLWGALHLQTALAVLLVAPEVFIPLRRAGAEFHASTEGLTAAARIVDILDQDPGRADAANETEGAAAPNMHVAAPVAAAPVTTSPVTTSPVTTAPLAVRTPRPPDLRVEGLCVTYPNRAGPAIDDLHLHAAAGTRVALVGPSGAGKSSVLGVLLGFIAPAAGAVSLRDAERSPAGSARSLADAATTQHTLAHWRRAFSWVPQRPHLFTDTLAANLRLGAPEATDHTLHAACAAVGLDRLVTHLPLGMETVLGQNGLTLSAGERQRVALARAVLHPAPILLLDEPTASLDPPAVETLAASLTPWLAGRTVVVAAHHPVLFGQFDEVIVLPPPPHVTPS